MSEAAADEKRGRRQLLSGLATGLAGVVLSTLPIFPEPIRKHRAGERAIAPVLAVADGPQIVFANWRPPKGELLPRAPMGRLVLPLEPQRCRICKKDHGVYTKDCLPVVFYGCPGVDDEIGISGFVRTREIVPPIGLYVMACDVRTTESHRAITDEWTREEDPAQIEAWRAEWAISRIGAAWRPLGESR